MHMEQKVIYTGLNYSLIGDSHNIGKDIKPQHICVLTIVLNLLTMHIFFPEVKLHHFSATYIKKIIFLIHLQGNKAHF